MTTRKKIQIPSRGGQETAQFRSRKAGAHAHRLSKRHKTRAAKKSFAMKEW
jgi:hypothetical protein